MAKLIDAEQLKQQKTVLWDPALGFCDCVLVEDIDNAPAVNAVEVVRCGNCKYYVENHYGDMVCQHPEQDGDWLDAAWLNTNPDDFCSHGENKEASPHGDAK